MRPLHACIGVVTVAFGCGTDADEGPRKLTRADAEAPTASPVPAPPAPGADASQRALVPVIVAQGLMGRTTISCDDGKTWLADRSFDKEGSEMVCGDTTPVRCGESSCKKKNNDGSCEIQTPCDCMHDSGFGKGVAIANEKILANFGWGRPMVLMRSTNGIRWENFAKFQNGYPEIVYAANRYILFSDVPKLSDDGVVWRDGAPSYSNGGGVPWRSPRAFSFLAFESGRFIGAIDGNGIRITPDRGESWSTATVPEGCTDGIGNRKILTGNDLAVIVTSSHKSCRSADGGSTWTIHDIPMSPNAMLFEATAFVNGKFLAFTQEGLDRNAIRWSSTDGVTWTPTETHNAPLWFGNAWMAVSLKGTLVSTNGGQYGSQVFLRSTDEGLTWTEAASYEKGHFIDRYGVGTIAPNDVCRAP
jgi:hypothetical protein